MFYIVLRRICFEVDFNQLCTEANCCECQSIFDDNHNDNRNNNSYNNNNNNINNNNNNINNNNNNNINNNNNNNNNNRNTRETLMKSCTYHYQRNLLL